VDLNQISLLYLLIFIKSQAPPHHPKPFSTFLWGDPDQAAPGNNDLTFKSVQLHLIQVMYSIKESYLLFEIKHFEVSTSI
jgi:hypothetical protein